MKKNFFVFRNSKKSGESLIEVLVSIIILVLFMTSIFTMVNRSIVLNENIRSRVIALNLAREGIEGVRNIRDTNWLRFSGDRRNKWLCLTASCDESEPTDLISDGSYHLDFSSGDGVYELVSSSYSDLFYSDYQLYRDGEDLYSHDSTGTSSKFYRQIKLSLTSSPNCSSSCPDRLVVTSRVGWNGVQGPQEVLLETYLFDYYERNAY